MPNVVMHVAAVGLAALMAVGGAIGGASSARAETADLREDIADWLLRLYEDDATLYFCSQRLEDRRVRFSEITERDPYLSAPVREKLNEIIKQAIPKTWVLMSGEAVASTVNEGSVFARDRASASDVVADFEESQTVLRASVVRNHLDIARLKIEIVLTQKDGRICDSATRQWHFNTNTLDRVPAPPFSATAVDIYDINATLRDGLRTTIPRNLGAEEDVPFMVTSKLEGQRCAVSSEQLTRQLFDAAREIQDNTGIAVSDGAGRAFVPLSPDEAETVPHLQVLATTSVRIAEEHADDVAVITFTWRDGARRRPGESRIVALQPGALKRCVDGSASSSGRDNRLEIFLANARKSEAHQSTMAPLASPFQVGDLLEIDLTIDQPVFPYCWALLQDEDEANGLVFYPFSERSANRPLDAKTYRIPHDLNKPDQKLLAPGTILFHCFVIKNRAPNALLNRWLEAHKAQRYLDWNEVESLAKEFRQITNISEIYAWIRVEAS
ncbi:hypothetical protein [Acuticoccus sediminis]|nr:hypothetical protein [Acuticoccus sediminis]